MTPDDRLHPCIITLMQRNEEKKKTLISDCRRTDHPGDSSFHLLRDVPFVEILPADPAAVTHAAKNAPLDPQS